MTLRIPCDGMESPPGEKCWRAPTLYPLWHRFLTPLFVYICENTWAEVLLWCLFILYLSIFYYSRGKGPSNHPPKIRSWIPWLGHAVSFLRDVPGFLEWTKTKYPDAGIKSMTIAGRTVYITADPNLAAQIYKNSRSFSSNPLALRVFSAVGCSASDISLLDGRLLEELHKMSTTYLQGKGLDVMTDVFMRTLGKGLDRYLEKEEGDSEGWIEVDMVEFVKKQWTLASTASLYGTSVLEREGEDAIYNWLWDFDVQVLTLLTKLPDIITPRAAGARERGLEILTTWERAAKASSLREKGAGNDEVWDKDWGLNFCRDRANLTEMLGVSESGRAAVQLALFWGLNANTIPAATWVVIQAILPVNALIPAVLSEIGASQTAQGAIDVQKLNTQLHLPALLLEAYRWSVSSPGVRVLLQDADVGPYTLLKGGTTMVHSRTMQLDPETWGPNAHLFDASRFLPTSISSLTAENVKTRKLSMRQFGGGHNLCPGRHFAGNEILGGFAVLMQKLEIEILEDKLKEVGVPMVRVEDGKQGGLWPDREFWVKLRKRR